MRQSASGGDFGVRSHGKLLLLLLGIVPVTTLGWMIEHPGSWWASGAAKTVWLGAVPLWTLAVGTLWKPASTRVLGALLSLVIAYVSFVGGVAVRFLWLSEDALWVGGRVAAASIAGFLLGMVVRVAIRRARATAKSE